MRIQIADDEGNLLYVPAMNTHLESDLRALFPQHPRWRRMKNRRTRHAIGMIEAAVWQLRLDSRFSSEPVEPEHDG